MAAREDEFVPPAQLIEQILAGRCVAFVGAGFSAEVAPGWKALLEGIAKHLPPAACREVEDAIARATTAFELEMVGQMLRDRFERRSGPAFEDAVTKVLDPADKRDRMTNRLRWLHGIPFEAVLTTNIDSLLSGDPPSPERYHEVLREPLVWWRRADWNRPGAQPSSRVLTLHWRAGKEGERPQVVLARSDYRSLLYEDSRYANFLRAVFATRTVLFLGVSFTDAYLNEIRSETFALVGHEKRPLGYAVFPDLARAQRDHFRRHEGIEILGFSTRPDGDGKPTTWAGFDSWLEAIFNRTSAEARMASLVGGKTVLWVDEGPERNAPGIQRLEAAGAHVQLLARPEDLDREAHQRAHLVITQYGHPEKVGPRVLRLLAGWVERPPVIVYAGGEYADINRAEVLRLGAFEYTCNWKELFEIIERLFGREVGR